MRSLILLPLAVMFWGCPAPIFSELLREPAPDLPDPAQQDAEAFYKDQCAPHTDSTSTWRVSCTPDLFNVHVGSRHPSRIDVRTVDGRVESGRSILVQRDTAFLGRQAVPMASVDDLWIVERRTLGSRAQLVGASAAAWSATGGMVGLLGGSVDPERTALEGGRDGLVGGALVGLGFGLLLDRIEPKERFVVSGWHDPALVPGPPGLLVTDGAEPTASYPGGPPCHQPSPIGIRWISRCTSPDVLTQRSGTDWVDQVTVHLRNGGHLQGRDLVVTDSDMVLDGVRRPLGAVSHVELQSLRGPWRVARPTARGALTGLGYGLVMGAGIALASGDTDPLWQVPLGLGAFGASTGLTLGLARGRVRVRDVTHLPAPGP